MLIFGSAVSLTVQWWTLLELLIFLQRFTSSSSCVFWRAWKSVSTRQTSHVRKAKRAAALDSFSAEFRVVHWWAELRSHVANQVYVVVEVAHKVVRDVVRRPASVPDELPLGHLVFDVRAAQVDGQQDQTVAQDVHGVCEEATDNIEMKRLVSHTGGQWGLVKIGRSYKYTHVCMLCVNGSYWRVEKKKSWFAILKKKIVILRYLWWYCVDSKIP